MLSETYKYLIYIDMIRQQRPCLLKCLSAFAESGITVVSVISGSSRYSISLAYVMVWDYDSRRKHILSISLAACEIFSIRL